MDCFYRTISKRAKNWIKNSVEVFTKKKLWDKEELPQNDILVIAKLERRLFPNASDDLPSNQKGTGNSIGFRKRHTGVTELEKRCLKPGVIHA